MKWLGIFLWVLIWGIVMPTRVMAVTGECRIDYSTCHPVTNIIGGHDTVCDCVGGFDNQTGIVCRSGYYLAPNGLCKAVGDGAGGTCNCGTYGATGNCIPCNTCDGGDIIVNGKSRC